MPVDGRRALSHAVAGLHRTFHPYPYRPAMPACPHCVSDADVHRLSRPLDELAVDDVRRYARKAITTWGDARDFKRVLPRLAELMTSDAVVVDPQTVTGKLRRAAWSRWPEPERAAVHRFLRAWWVAGLAEPPSSRCLAHRRLAAIAVAEPDLGPFLDDWHKGLAADGPVRLGAVLHLVQLVIGHAGPVGGTGWAEALFDQPAGVAGATLTAWLTGSTTTIQLERAAYDYAGAPHGGQVAAAAGALERHQPQAPLRPPPAGSAEGSLLDQLPAPPGQKLRR